QLQTHLAPMFKQVFPNPMAPRTVIVIPSHSLDSEELSKITGIHHYEERLLCLLMLLQLPRTQMIFVTSLPIDPTIIDYYLHLLPGIPGNHARRRLTLLSCHDSSQIPLTLKILQRPRLLQRIQKAIAVPDAAHISCFNATNLERTLAVQLGVPLYACDPALAYLGNKSKGREIFREAGVLLPDGVENLRDDQDIVDALTSLKEHNPALSRAVIKLNDGFSGEGNALFSYEGCPVNGRLRPWIQKELPQRIRFEATHETWTNYRQKFIEMGGIVESWIEGEYKRSPSVQARINPLRQPVIISTHDQILGGPSGQVFLGCSFPADEAYRLDIQEAGMRIAEKLRDYGVLGRFGVDFISVKTAVGWSHYAIEINLRKGGTTLPFLMLQFLTNGEYDSQTGLFHAPGGRPRYYYASDNLQNRNYRNLAPEDLIDISIANQLHFHATKQEGIVFHLMGALPEFGKFGAVCIGDSAEKAKSIYEHALVVMKAETQLPTYQEQHVYGNGNGYGRFPRTLPASHYKQPPSLSA
ncbi:MAG: ATP-grasp domain-containing protein, partial [Anaerolineales bacterium]|nr:ATP-grasp domain-containing protein [Anaerolineales bacterium]